MRRTSSFVSPPPSPHPVPLPVSSSANFPASCPELDLSVAHSPAHSHRNSQQSDQSGLRTRPQRQAGRKGKKQVCFDEPVIVRVTPETRIPPDALPQQPIRAQRRSRGRHNAPKEQLEPLAAASNENPSCLERAELNTTLALKAKLQSLQGVEFNRQKAVQETLRGSERTKHLINTRASEVVNVPSSQLLYSSLVSIDVQKDRLISQALQEKLLLAPASRCHSNKTADGPSILPFMTSDLFRQMPLPPEEGQGNIKPQAVTHHARSAFDLFRRQTRHEATP